jgi:Tol biopolymer transport system component
MKKQPVDVELAVGFVLSERIGANRQIAFRKDFSVCLSYADIRDDRLLFDDRQGSLVCPLAWNSRGTTVYHSYAQIYAIEAETAAAKAVTDFPESEQFSVTWILNCSPDEKRLFFRQTFGMFSQETLSGRSRLCTVGTDGTDFQVLMEEAGGRRIWFSDVHWRRNLVIVSLTGTEEADVVAMDLQGENRRSVTQIPIGTGRLPLSPDGTEFAYSADNGVYVVSVATGDHIQLSREGTCPAWSPDGKYLAFIVEPDELWLVERATGFSKRIASLKGRNSSVAKRKGSGYANAPVWSCDGRLLAFNLTQARRLRASKTLDASHQPENPGLSDSNLKVDGRSEDEDQREGQSWDFIHKRGVVDFVERKVCINDGHWSDQAWSPVSHD